MKIHVVMFASLAHRLGIRSLTATLREGATVNEALDHLVEQHAAIAQMRPHLATAVNMSYVDGECALSDGDELALIPPVSGG